MERVHRAARGLSLGRPSFRAGQSTGASREVATFLFLLVAAAAVASAACRGPQVTDGIGGQSGDEGRRPEAPFLGTGGVSALPAPP
ncbi:MAG TPA: hypothetical protein VMG12_02665 [Polyangiaceae bacterium]|nr:hypothetical protein [Polyangiaceae bacterium]